MPSCLQTFQPLVNGYIVYFYHRILKRYFLRKVSIFDTYRKKYLLKIIEKNKC